MTWIKKPRAGSSAQPPAEDPATTYTPPSPESFEAPPEVKEAARVLVQSSLRTAMLAEELLDLVAERRAIREKELRSG